MINNSKFHKIHHYNSWSRQYKMLKLTCEWMPSTMIKNHKNIKPIGKCSLIVLKCTSSKYKKCDFGSKTFKKL